MSLTKGHWLVLPVVLPHAQGTADAVRQYMWLFDEAVRDGVEDFLILSGDHLYRMDYRDFVRKHRESGAAITIAALPCAEKEVRACLHGVLACMARRVWAVHALHRACMCVSLGLCCNRCECVGNLACSRCH